MLVSLLFALWVHEDLREIDRFERPLLIKAERAGNHEQVESTRLVFGTQREKLRGERRAWLWVIAGSGAASVLGLGMGWMVPWVLQSRTSKGFSRLG